MASGRVNRFTRKQTSQLVGQRRAINGDKPIQDPQTGFLCHPQGFPLQARRKWFIRSANNAADDQGHIGIMFDSEQYYRPGCVLELTIPVRERLEQFTGKVVLVRYLENHFEIGLWLDQGDDAGRARIVEQICHIETYLKIKKYREGPYNLDPERVANEWIAKYAAGVPSLQ